MNTFLSPKAAFEKWLKTAESEKATADLTLDQTPELFEILKNVSDPGSVLEMFFDYCRPGSRKQNGVFYTPRYIAESMVKKSLQEYLGVDFSYHKLCNIKILDPSCGAGEFLLAAFYQLLELHRKFNKDLSFEKTAKFILQNNLYGIDCSSDALDLWRQRTELLGGCENFEKHFIRCNSLDFTDAGKCFKNNIKFDIVIGNPPYVSYGLRQTGKLKNSDAQKLKKLFPNSAQYKITVYALFIEFAVNSTADNGIHSFILPDSFLCGQYFTNLRNFLLKNCSMKKIVLLRKKVFNATPGSLVIYFLRKNAPFPGSFSETLLLENGDVFDLDKTSYTIFQDEFLQNHLQRFRLFFNASDHQKVKDIEKKSVCKLGDLLTLASGVIGKNGKKSIVSTIKKSDGNYCRGITSGKFILQNKQPVWQGEYINIDPQVIKSGLGKIDYSKEKILIRQTADRIIAAVDKQGLAVTNNIHAGTAVNADIDLDKLCSYLNSPEINFYYQAITLEAHRAMAQTDLETLRELPMPEFFKTSVK